MARLIQLYTNIVLGIWKQSTEDLCLNVPTFSNIYLRKKVFPRTFETVIHYQMANYAFELLFILSLLFRNVQTIELTGKQ